MVQRHRVKISATVDPDVLAAVDAYAREQPDRDRSSVIDEALVLWLAREQERAMEAQFDGPGAPEDEWRAWSTIRDAATRDRLARGR